MRFIVTDSEMNLYLFSSIIAMVEIHSSISWFISYYTVLALYAIYISK